MSLFVDQLENLCRTGAEQLSVDARKRLCDALQRLHVPSGGYAGLDGAPDPYYSFFVYQCLTALDVPIDREALLDYASHCTPQTYVDRVAAEALRQACTAQWSPTAALRLLLRSSSESEAYGRFFALWQADRAFSPRILSWWARIAWLGLRKQVVQVYSASPRCAWRVRNTRSTGIVKSIAILWSCAGWGMISSERHRWPSAAMRSTPSTACWR